ncbi:DUF5594 family protein [Cupriavidus basilensis]
MRVEVLPGNRTGWPRASASRGAEWRSCSDSRIRWMSLLPGMDSKSKPSLRKAENGALPATWSALPAKLRAWQEPRQLDWSSLSQADPAVLIGGLDFEH